MARESGRFSETITGDVLDTDDRIMAGFDAAFTAATGGLAAYGKALLSTGKTASATYQAINRGVNTADDLWDVGNTLYNMQDDPLRALGGFALGRGMNFAARGVANAVQSRSANKTATTDVSGSSTSKKPAFDASSSSRTKPSDLDAELPKNKAGDSASASSSRTSKPNPKNSDLSNNSVESRAGTDKAPSSAGHSQASPSSSSRSGSDVSHVDTGKADLPNKATANVASAGSSAAAAKSASKPSDLDVLKAKPDVEEPKTEQNAGKKSGSEGTKYYRVQGGGDGTQISRERIIVNSDGSVTIPDKNSTLYVSAYDAEHAIYYRDSARPGGTIIEFEVPKELDDLVQESAIPQFRAKYNPKNQGGMAPQIVDPTTPGTSYGLPEPFVEWIEEYATLARVLE